jgi:quinol monooxygenase YgiN
MVLYIVKYDILPDKAEAYLKWAQGAIPRALAVPGLAEFRAYRGLAGPLGLQVVLTYEFADLADWAIFRAHEDMQKLDDELRQFTANLTAELWGPSPVVPQPIRPTR